MFGNIISSLLAGPAERRQKIKPGLDTGNGRDTDPHGCNPVPLLPLLTFEKCFQWSPRSGLVMILVPPVSAGVFPPSPLCKPEKV